LSHIIYSSTSSVVTIDNYRNFDWTAVKSAEVNYETRTYDLDKMSDMSFPLTCKTVVRGFFGEILCELELMILKELLLKLKPGT